MIEVEYDDVGLAAIDAWMSPKVLANQRPVLFAVAADPRDFLPDVGVAVPNVVLTPVLRVTSATAPLPAASGFVGERELVNRLESAAVVAPLGRGHRRQRTGNRHGEPLRSGSALRSA